MPPVTGPDRSSAPVFRPVRASVVALVIGAAMLIGGVAMAITLPERYGPIDRVMCVGIAAGTAALMSRYATMHARAGESGLWVRNIGPGELVPWEEIAAVRFSEGMPWVRIDLTDGTDMAVMAIQRADGTRSLDEAQRLADLVGR